MENYFEQFDQDIQEKPINWRDVFDALIMHWKWFVISVIIAGVLGGVYLRMQNDVFELRSNLLIIDQARSGQMSEMSVLKQLDAAGFGGGRASTSFINNEEQVLKSTLIMRRVVEELELYVSYSKKRFLKTYDLYNESPIYVSIDSLSLSKLSSTLSFTFAPNNGGYLIEGSYLDENFSQKVKQLPSIVHTPAGIVYIKKRENTDPIDSEIIVGINSPSVVARSLVKGALTTEVAKMLDVINLSIKTTNAQKGRDILNKLTDVYNQDATEQNNLSVINTAIFIDSRLSLLTGELSEVEREVESYKKSNQLTDIEQDARNILSRNNIYDQQQVQVEIQQHLIKYIQDFLKDPANKEAMIPNLGLVDVGLLSAINKYNELLLTRERIKGSSSDDNPALRTMNQQIATARNAIEASIRVSKDGVQISNRNLQAQNTQLQSRLSQIPRQEREFVEIKRQQQVKESLFLFLLQKREEASLSMAVTVPKGRVLDMPEAAVKIGPKSKLIILVFLFLGLIFPALVIYILHLINTTIKSGEDIEKISDITVLTELGHEKSESVFINYQPNASPNSELFRLLRTKLQFALDFPKEKVIIVTSTVTGEGKTFVSTNLSVMLSLADKKVIVLGLDLRKPQIAKNFSIESKIGITSFLSGQVDDYNSLIFKSKDYPLLDILPAGIIPPNPTELIMKEKFDFLIAELKQQYDYIVIDTAPVGAVSDTLLVERVADITLYIARAGYTDKQTIEYANRLNKEKSLKRMYFVLNDVELELSKYSYRRKYGYGYGMPLETK
jgi:tyrosine-protein kinase Etk/Wzc